MPFLPENGKQQEYKDVTHPQLRIMRYPSSLSFLFKTTHRYKPICETLGTYPYMAIQDARSAVYERMQALQSGTYSLGKNKRLDEVYQTLYLTDLKLNKRNTASELYKVKKYILPRFGDSKIGKIERQDIESFKLDLCAHLQPSSVNKILAALSRMFTLSVEHGYLASSPMNGIKRLKENNQRHRVLTTDERQGFITACHALQTPGANSLLLSSIQGCGSVRCSRSRIRTFILMLVISSFLTKTANSTLYRYRRQPSQRLESSRQRSAFKTTYFSLLTGPMHL